MKAKAMALVLAAAFLVTFAAPVSADSSAQQGVDIRIKAGSTQMKVNGQVIKITAPYSAGGTTMLPIAVFTKGLGASLTLKNNKIISLKTPKHTVIVTVGSKSATADGNKLTLPAAPGIKNSVTFVPIKVAQSLGAKVSTDASTKEITITAVVAGAVTPESSVIDSDSGKSKIGDSYYQWSMNYPSGLVQDSQSEDGDYLLFVDMKKDYYLMVNAQTAPDDLTTREKRERLAEGLEPGETVLDKRTVTGANKLSYEKMVTKNKDGFMFEIRGMQANGYFYFISFGKKAKNVSELSPFTGVLDSFKPSFANDDRSLKDLTKIKDGLKSFKNEDYGLTVRLPKEWKTNEKDYSYPYYETPTSSLSMEVYSVTEGDTLEAWVQRDTEDFKSIYVESYRKVEETKQIVWSGKPAIMVKISYSNDTQTWWHNYRIYSIQGNYRYYTVLGMTDEKEDKSAEMLQAVLNSLQVDFSVIDRNFGSIVNETETADLTATATKTSRQYGYSITLPKHWTGVEKDFESDNVSYELPGGKLDISVLAGVSTAEVSRVYEAIEGLLKTREADDSNVRVLSNEQVTFAGQSAKKYVVEDKSNTDDAPHVEIVYVFEKNGNVYGLTGAYYLANATDYVKKPLEAAMNSFTFTK